MNADVSAGFIVAVALPSLRLRAVPVGISGKGGGECCFSDQYGSQCSG